MVGSPPLNGRILLVEDDDAIRQLGAAAYVLKPFDIHVLLETVAAHIGRTATGQRS